MKNEKRRAVQKRTRKWISMISLKNNFHLADIHLVAGIDIAYWTEGKKITEFVVLS